MSKSKHTVASFEEEDDDEEGAAAGVGDGDATSASGGGYEHYNSSSDVEFTISLWGTDLCIAQNPSAKNLGHGAVVWDAAVIFSKFMEHSGKSDFSSSNLQGKRVLELGSGCGLGGMAFMLRGAQVTLTDLQPVVETLTELNARRLYARLTSNGALFEHPIIAPIVHAVDWTNDSIISSSSSSSRNSGGGDEQQQPYDVILLTDCVFSALLVPHLLRTILQASAVGKTTVYVCHEIRDEEANALFVSELSKKFTCKRVGANKQHPDFKHKSVEIIVAKLKRKTKGTKCGEEEAGGEEEEGGNEEGGHTTKV